MVFCLLALMAGKTYAQDSASEPLVATVRLGGTDTLWLDPTFVSAISGAVNSEPLAASTFGDACTGTVAASPDVVLEWTEDATVDRLRIFFTSNGDSTLVIVTPDGYALCADDLNPLELDPMIDIANPESGSYAIYVGSFEGDAVEPGFLVFTSGDYSPATLDLAAFAPALNPEAAPVAIPLEVLNLSETPSADPASADLEAGFGIYSQEMTTAGSIAAFNIELGNDTCTGFIDSVPTFAFSFSGESEGLRAYFEGDHDATLVIRTPTGEFSCADDFGGAANLNPLVDFETTEGEYLVFVGSFAPGASISGTLTITEDLSAQPAALTAAELGNQE